MKAKKRINNSKNRLVYYPSYKYQTLVYKLDAFIGFNSSSSTTNHIVRSFFDDRPDLVNKLDRMKLDDND